ncbi:MAG: hypothetical protein HY594_02425 [Candidatus Omnitrophica bacterium]|nr:hypothetical protein [Candidatus Omnitrophota bacterium]
MIEGGPEKSPLGRPKSNKPADWMKDRLGAVSTLLGRRRTHAGGKGSSDALLNRLYTGNRLLTLAILLLGLYLISDLVGARKANRSSSRGVSASGAAASGGTGATKPDDYLRPMSVYIQSASRRNPFTEPGAPPAETVAKPKPDEQRAKTAAQGLAVVGIDRSGTPRALIEDSAQHRTYFVRVGEEINGMKVKSISSSGVVLNLEGEDVELPY